MRCRALLLLSAIALTSCGCLVVSLQPAYDEGSVVFDGSLLGAWEDADDGLRATVERGEWRSYKIIYADRSSTREFQGNTTRIGDTTYLDLTEMRGIDPGPYLVPVHGVLRVVVDGDTLTAGLLDYNWVIHAMTDKTIGRLAPALDDRRNAVVTAPTSELRRWLVRPPEDAFSAPMTFIRKPVK